MTMSDIGKTNPIYSQGTGIQANSVPIGTTVATALPQNSSGTNSFNSIPSSSVYNYPATSLYGANPISQTPQTYITPQSGTSNPQQASGVNIYIYNPSGIGGGAPVVTSAPQPAPAASTPISASPVSDKIKKASDKVKNVVELTDDYIKTLESYLRSPDSKVRSTGIKELINRFEEDNSRYDNPALTALLNIALQDIEPSNRMLAMAPVSGGTAHGDENTVALLQNLQKSGELYGKEAEMANESLLNSVQKRVEVPDNSPDEDEDDSAANNAAASAQPLQQ